MAAAAPSSNSFSSLEASPNVVLHSVRVPLERGSIEQSGIHRSSKRQKKKVVRFPRDDCEFYVNIWNPPASTTLAHSQELKYTRFIDIVQVAHALNHIDYKSDYIGAAMCDDSNIWTVSDSEMASGTVLSPTRDERSTVSEDANLNASAVRRILSQESNRSHTPPSELKTLQRILSMQGTKDVRTLAVSPPSKYAEGHFIFSTVLSQVELRDRWSSKFLLCLHEPVRHALYVIDRFLERAHSKDADACNWDTGAFFSWFDTYFCEYIKAQHDIKANVLRPLVQIKYAANREIVECYEEIDFMKHAIMTQEKMFPMTAASAVQSWQRRVLALQEDIRKLNVVLYHVLNLEERALQPALIATFNEETFYKFVMPRVYGYARPKRLVIPWMIERAKVWGSQDDVMMFKKQLSFPSRFLYDRIWYPHFVRHVVAAMKVLDTSLTEMPSEAAEESWFGCVIQ